MDSDRLRQLFDYEPASGRLIRLCGKRAGSEAGWVEADGYRRVQVGTKSYREHHLVWLWHGNPPIPPGMYLDHINGQRDDNRIDNLRACTMSQNLGNAKRYKNNKTGFKGVILRDGRYEAQIWADGRPKYIGTFSTAAEAHDAYMAEARKLFGEFARAA